MITRQEAKLRAKSMVTVTNVLNLLVPIIVATIATMIVSAIVSVIVGLIGGILTIPFTMSDSETAGIVATIIAIIIQVITSIIMAVIISAQYVVTYKAVYGVVTKGENTNIGEMMSYCFNIKPHLKTSILYMLFTTIGSFACGIPGMIVAVLFFPCIMISIMNPNNTWKQNFSEASTFMKAHLGELIVLWLSFIGWVFLGVMCCFIPYIVYVGPWMLMTVGIYIIENYTGNPTLGGTPNSNNNGNPMGNNINNGYNTSMNNMGNVAGMGAVITDQPTGFGNQNNFGSQPTGFETDNSFDFGQTTQEPETRRMFKQAILNTVEIDVTFIDSTGNQRETTCHPMDIMEDMNGAKYQMYGRTSNGEMKPLTLSEDKIVKVQLTTDRFNPGDHVNWKPNWKFARNWGNLS